MYALNGGVGHWQVCWFVTRGGPGPVSWQILTYYVSTFHGRNYPLVFGAAGRSWNQTKPSVWIKFDQQDDTCFCSKIITNKMTLKPEQKHG